MEKSFRRRCGDKSLPPPGESEASERGAPAAALLQQMIPPPPWRDVISEKKAKHNNRRYTFDPEQARVISLQPMLIRLAEDNDIRQIDYAIRETKCDAVREEQIVRNAEMRGQSSKQCDYDYSDPTSIHRKFWDTVDKREKVREDFLANERKNIRKQYGHIIELKKLRELKKQMDKDSMSKTEELNKEQHRTTLEKKKALQQRLMEKINVQNDRIIQQRKKMEEEQKHLESRMMEANRRYQDMKDESAKKWKQVRVEQEKLRNARYESVVVDLNTRTEAELGRKDIWKEDHSIPRFHRIDSHKDKVLKEIREVGIPEKLIYGARRKSNIILKKAKASDPSAAPTVIRDNILSWE